MVFDSVTAGKGYEAGAIVALTMVDAPALIVFEPVAPAKEPSSIVFVTLTMVFVNVAPATINIAGASLIFLRLQRGYKCL